MTTYEKEREQLRTIQGIFEQAIEQNNIEQLRPHCDPEFSFVSFSDRAFADFNSFQKQWNETRSSMVGNGSFKTQLNPEPSLFEGDIAICHGNSNNQMVNKSGDNFNFSSNWTVIFKRSNGEWKVLRAHNSLNPFSNPMLDKGIKSSFSKLGVAAFISGGLICSLLTYMILR